jgi:hypothetical protein
VTQVADKTAQHLAVLTELHELYQRKNADYGDSFSQLYREFGLTSAVIRLTDKLERLKRLTKTEAQVKNESIRDTLLDLANYAAMAVMEMDAKGD